MDAILMGQAIGLFGFAGFCLYHRDYKWAAIFIGLGTVLFTLTALPM